MSKNGQGHIDKGGRYIHIMEYYTVIKRNEVLIRSAT